MRCWVARATARPKRSWWSTPRLPANGGFAPSRCSSKASLLTARACRGSPGPEHSAADGGEDRVRELPRPRELRPVPCRQVEVAGVLHFREFGKEGRATGHPLLQLG